MTMIRMWSWLAGGMVVLAGCAHGGSGEAQSGAAGERSHSLQEVDSAPELLGCNAYEPPPGGMGGGSFVRVRFDVSHTGEVVNPAVVEVSPTARARGAVDRALAAARSCRYTPAYLDGRPVTVRGVSRRFSLAL